jgi:hypothetical protein
MDHWPAAGENIHYRVFTTFAGEPVDPDPGSIKADVPRLILPPNELVRIGTGQYEGNFTVPEGIDWSVTFQLNIAATYTIGNFTVKRNAIESIFYELLFVCYHKVDAGPTGATLRVHARDLNMNALEGAEVRLQWTLRTVEDGVQDYYSDSQEGMTDVNGKTTFKISYPTIDPDEPILSICGYVYFNGVRQDFEGTVDISNKSLYIGSLTSGLEFEIQNQLPLPLESVVPLDFILSKYSTPIPNSDVGYMVYSPNEVVTYGRATTNMSGRFQIIINTPEKGTRGSDYIRLTISMFVATESGTEWLLYSIPCQHPKGMFFEWYDEEMEIEVVRHSPQEAFKVSLSSIRMDGEEETAWLAWGTGPIDWENEYSLVGKTWTKISSGSMFGGMMVVPCTFEEGNYIANVTVSDFLPNNSEVYFVGVIEFYDSGLYIHKLAFVEGIPLDVQEDSTGGDSDAGGALVIILIASLFLIILIFSFVFRRNK